MDLEKLQKLSCLSLKDEQKPALETSIEGVLAMMGDVEALSVGLTELSKPELKTSVFTPVALAEATSAHVLTKTPEQLRVAVAPKVDSSIETSAENQNTSNLISNQTTNLNLKDGYFLAPKAIKQR